MKKTALLLLFVLMSIFAYAQKTDTIKKRVEGGLMLSTNDVIQNLSQSTQLSIFILLVDKAGLTDTLKNLNTLTIFAPDNNAFEKKGEEWLDTIEDPANKQRLRTFILDHVFNSVITSREIVKQIQHNKGPALLNTISGQIWAANIDNNRNIVITSHNGVIDNVVRQFDIPQKNGELFIVNNIMQPETSN